MANNLGMNSMNVMVLVGGLALFGLGGLIYNAAGFQSGIDSADTVRNMHATGNLLMDLGTLVAGGILMVVAFSSDTATTPMRIALFVVGALIAFHSVLSFSVGASAAA